MSSSFTRVQPLPFVAYTFTDTKLNVEFFYMGTTTPVRRFTDTKLDVEFFTKGTTTPNTLCILRPKILTDHFYTHNTNEV